mmetsp:Transcript_23/g.64  ORF Transcript_23/g.64 Transcript_23/m.64 type:complete len:84 (-) Transcript_23:933-1184(-)
MCVVQVKPLVSNSSYISRKNKHVVKICRALDEVEFCNERVLDPIADEFSNQHNAAHGVVVKDHGFAHFSLKAVEEKNKEQEEG